jgi:hypothetical protein
MPFDFFRGDGYLWFRVFGYGLHFKDTERNPHTLFSERSKRGFKLGKWRVKALKRGE